MENHHSKNNTDDREFKAIIYAALTVFGIAGLLLLLYYGITYNG